MSAPAHALKIELKDAAPDRIERQRSQARGEALPGTPDIAATSDRLAKLDLDFGDPIVIRIFKQESELEVWMLKEGRYVKFATYPICHWSGTLGPKFAEGDKQSPEGFYTITRRQMHRSGRWPRSLNIGFPNAFDRAHLRTGSYILIHGGCSSVGCYAMTNGVSQEIFDLVEKALRSGQRHVPVHIFPFRMTDKNLSKHKKNEWSGFWTNLKEGFDSFERTRLPPIVSVCNGRYVFEDGRPAEVGLESRPLDVCGRTATILASEAELQHIVSHPSRWAKLSAEEKSLTDLLSSPLPLIHKRRITALARASSSGGGGKGKGGTYRTRSRVTVQCDLRRPSCRRFLALKHKRINKRAASKRRADRRRQSASNRRR